MSRSDPEVGTVFFIPDFLKFQKSSDFFMQAELDF
mgnify:CR=1 FL=1